MSAIKLFIAGDSTAATYPSDQSPMAGWGQLLQALLDDGVEVHNHASCGRSSKSFISEERLKSIAEQIGSGDYLFIQFGHNDQKPDEERRTEPSTTYKEYLKMYIDTARQAGAQSVLLTSVERRKFNEDGTLADTHGNYPAAMRELAAELTVPLIDVQPLTRALYLSYGPEESKQLFTWLAPGEHPNYPEGAEDNTHFNETGARAVAGLVAQQIRKLPGDLPAHVKAEE